MVKRLPSQKTIKDHFANGVVIPQFADLTPDSIAAIKKLYYVPCFEHICIFVFFRVQEFHKDEADIHLILGYVRDNNVYKIKPQCLLILVDS